MTEIRKAALIGGGVIGAGWAARLLLTGIDVAVFDPDPEAERKVAEVLANAERAYGRLTMAPLPPRGALTFHGSVRAAVDGVDLVQESAPERVELKQRLLAEIDSFAQADALIGSSTSGILPTELQAKMGRPERLVVAHPFNPVYLLPLVEIVGGQATSPASIERAKMIYGSIGMKPVHIRREIEAFVGDRLLEALWREALWLVHDDIATAEEIDDIVRYSFGLRWAQMGTFMTYRIAGGEAGMRHFMSQFGPCLAWPWTKLMDTPPFDEALVDKIVAQSDAQAGDRSIRELERIRDDNLVAILQALKAQRWGAGALLQDFEEQLYARSHRAAATAEHDLTRPLRLLETSVSAAWIDYNGHMNESRYLQLFGDMTDALLRLVGVDGDYVAKGQSYYTVETHLMHLAEVGAGEPVYGTTQILSMDEKRFHHFHQLFHGKTDKLLATAEQMMLHVDTRAQKACPANAAVLARLGPIAAAHASLLRPEVAGRHVGQRRNV